GVATRPAPPLPRLEGSGIGWIRRHELRKPGGSDSRQQVVTEEVRGVIRAQIPGPHLDPDEHVGAGPRLGLETEQRELLWKVSSVVVGDESVDAGAVGIDVTSC